jgi:hypothetical protein
MHAFIVFLLGISRRLVAADADDSSAHGSLSRDKWFRKTDQYKTNLEHIQRVSWSRRARHHRIGPRTIIDSRIHRIPNSCRRVRSGSGKPASLSLLLGS